MTESYATTQQYADNLENFEVSYALDLKVSPCCMSNKVRNKGEKKLGRQCKQNYREDIKDLGII